MWRKLCVADLDAIRDPADRLAFTNDLLEHVDAAAQSLVDPLRELQSLRYPPGPGVTTRYASRPRTPLNDAALLTNAHGEPSLASELRAELDSADSVDLLCAFVMWRGVRLLERELSAMKDAGVPFRVVTTTYIGGTEREALDRLVRDYGAEVKVQYDAARTRLHAKAWLFHRNTGFDTAYVGSSNLSTSALLEGVEWNVRLANSTTPSLMQKFKATFDSYWNSNEFEDYDPDRDRDRLDDALNEASGRRQSDRVTISLSGLQVSAFPYQQEMLDALMVERILHDRHRNLVVAATGTGKTVIAALDYRATVRAAGRRTADLAVCRSSQGNPRRNLCGPTRRCSPIRTSASCTSVMPGQSGGSMSLRAFNRFTLMAWTTSLPMPLTSSSLTSFTTPRRRPIGALSITSHPRNFSA